MPRSPKPHPTDAELAILNVLWERGPATVREVHGELERRGPAGYTTVLKQLQIMTEKGLVARDESARAHVYRPAVDRSATQRHLVRDLARKAFDGSPLRLVQQALAGERARPEELAEIRRLLEELEEDGR